MKALVISSLGSTFPFQQRSTYATFAHVEELSKTTAGLIFKEILNQICAAMCTAVECT